MYIYIYIYTYTHTYIYMLYKKAETRMYMRVYVGVCNTFVNADATNMQ